MSDTIQLAIERGVAVVTLHRPDKLNAFAGDMRDQLAAALEAVARDPAARVLVLTGAGRAFCAGGDVAHMEELKRRGAAFDDVRSLLDLGSAIVSRLATLPIPTLAAVHGVAAGAGMNLALACDLRLAADDAKFGETFVRIGLHPDWGGTFHLPRLVGAAKAKELCWTGEMIDAAEALRLGIVQRVYPAATFAADWRAFAERLAAAPQASVRGAKRTLDAAAGRTLAECLAAEAAAQADCWASSDVAEGLRAFVEKRAAEFAGDAPAPAGAAPSGASRRFE